MDLRYKKRPSRRLQEVIEADLLTAQEKYIQGTIGGYYSLNDEQAYFRMSGEKATMTVDEFEREIKKIHPQFFVMFNPVITPKHMCEGHSIGFYVPEFGGFVPLCKVGRSANNIISANSQGSLQKYIGKKSLKEKEKAILSRGYVAAREFCKQFLLDAKETGGIKRSRIVKAAEFMVMRDMMSNLGGKETIARMFKEARILANKEIDELKYMKVQKEKHMQELEKQAALEFNEEAFKQHQLEQEQEKQKEIPEQIDQRKEIKELIGEV